MSRLARALLATVLAGAAAAPAATAMPVDGPPAAPEAVFPVDGRHRIGMEAVQRFGGARGHDGQDIFADCGVPVVAALPGTVRHVETEGAGGNYLVIETADKRAAVYMHLAHAPKLAEGDTVAAGDRIGSVGKTGNAWDCHLHFELWTAPGWYRGTAHDPLPALRHWAG